MNFAKKLRLAAILAFAAFSFAALAQMGRNRLYNPATETTVTGAITEVNTVTGKGGWNGIHLTVQSEDAKYDVHVGPAAYMTKHDIYFHVGDHVQVLGSKVEYQGADALIAREITKDGKVVTLRDAHGFPVWSHGRWTSQ